MNKNWYGNILGITLPYDDVKMKHFYVIYEIKFVSTYDETLPIKHESVIKF